MNNKALAVVAALLAQGLLAIPTLAQAIRPETRKLIEPQPESRDIHPTVQLYAGRNGDWQPREHPDSATPSWMLPHIQRVTRGRLQVRDLSKHVQLRPGILREIPIRFVQFVDDPAQRLSDADLQKDIDRANAVFRPAMLHFYLYKNITIEGSEFTKLYSKGPDGERRHEYYTWPADVSQSPLIQPLGSSGVGFERPPENRERRYDAQMRAGSYCCPRGEILVYVNQGASNGGQYPWYSRIIGMSSYHLGGGIVFAHEIGHYLGLPHTFPSHKHYGIDYDLARVVDPLPDEAADPTGYQQFMETTRRVYEPHANLVNPETGGMAELSLFWDLVFKPDYSPKAQHKFFSSRVDAAKYESQLQPLETLGNAYICLAHDSRCQQSTAQACLQVAVSAKCRGLVGDLSDCSASPHHLYTGAFGSAGLSRPGAKPGSIQINIMSYGYSLADGSRVPGGVVDGHFISKSQIEQIQRVLQIDVKTRFFPKQWAERPYLGNRFLAKPYPTGAGGIVREIKGNPLPVIVYYRGATPSDSGYSGPWKRIQVKPDASYQAAVTPGRYLLRPAGSYCDFRHVPRQIRIEPNKFAWQNFQGKRLFTIADASLPLVSVQEKSGPSVLRRVSTFGKYPAATLSFPSTPMVACDRRARITGMADPVTQLEHSDLLSVTLKTVLNRAGDAPAKSPAEAGWFPGEIIIDELGRRHRMPDKLMLGEPVAGAKVRARMIPRAGSRPPENRDWLEQTTNAAGKASWLLQTGSHPGEATLELEVRFNPANPWLTGPVGGKTIEIQPAVKTDDSAPDREPTFLVYTMKQIAPPGGTLQKKKDPERNATPGGTLQKKKDPKQIKKPIKKKGG